MSDRLTPATPASPVTAEPRNLWHHPDFMKLWTAETVSQLGTQVTLLALPLTAIVILKASPFKVGLLVTLEFLPFILVGLPAGVWVDRMRRRPILIAGDLARAVVLGTVPLAYELHVLHIVQLYAVALLAGVGTVFFDVAYQSYLPSLVGREHLVDGNAKLEISRSGAQLAGPGLAGLLIQLIKAPVAIFADALSYLWSAAFVGLIRKKEPPVEVHPGGHPSMRSEIKLGLRFVWHHSLLRPIAFCTATSNLASSMTAAVILVFAVRVLGLNAGTIGLIFAIGNVGFFLGAFLSQRAARWLGVGPTIVWSALVFSTPPLLVPLASPGTAFPLLVAAIALGGFGGAVYNINQVSLRQAITAERMQGKMNATMRFMVWGTLPIGGFVGGVLGGAIGLRPTLWVAAIGGLAAFFPPLFSPVRKLREIPAFEEEPSPDTQVGESLASVDEGIVDVGHIPRAAEAESADRR
jgi:MFS family permease